MTPKQRRWLELVALASKRSSGMYAGEREDLIPTKVARWMEANGYVWRDVPHNPAHKDRFVITDASRDALAQSK